MIQKGRCFLKEKRDDIMVYSDYQGMLQKKHFNLVSIATPAIYHVEVIEAAQVGVKATSCEKAMAVSPVECDETIQICE